MPLALFFIGCLFHYDREEGWKRVMERLIVCRAAAKKIWVASRQFAFFKKRKKNIFFSSIMPFYFPTSVCIKRKRKSLWLWVVAKKLDHFFFRCNTSSQRHTGTFHLPKVSDIFVIACWPWETSFDSWIKSFLLLIRLSMLRFGFPVEKGVSDATVSSSRAVKSNQNPTKQHRRPTSR